MSTDVLGPGSLMWRLVGEARFLLTFSGNIVMQVMHPAVGAAVGRFSTYRTDPWGRAQRTADSLLLTVYGGRAAAEEAAKLRDLHRPIGGVDEHGRRYHALHPEPWAWVHNILFERLVTTSAVFGHPLDQSAQHQLYDEFRTLGRVLGIKDRHVPADLAAFRRYFDQTMSTTLENHPTARDVLARIRDNEPVPGQLPAPLRALWPAVRRPAGEFGYFLTAATLPPAVREVLRLPWSRADQRRLDRFAALVRHATPTLPQRLRYLPMAHHALAFESHRARIQHRARSSFV